MIALHTFPRRAAQAGFTIIEMMVALAIGLFIALGFTASFVNMKTAFRSQDGLAQLQDNERLALSVLTWSVQEAGYYPTGADLNATPPVPVLNVDRSEIVGSTLPAAVGGTMVQTQYLQGSPPAAGTSEFLSTAYVSKPGDGILTCQGAIAAPAGTVGDVAVRNVFYVDTVNKTLGCNVYLNGSPSGVGYAPLVTNVTGMTLYYGVDSQKNSDKQNSIDTYLTAQLVSAGAFWDYVKAVRVTLTFVDPNAKQTGSTADITWVQTINLMNNK